MMADSNKDTSTVTKQPTLGPEWKREVVAREGWSSFKLADFERLKKDFSADWALVNYPPPEGLDLQMAQRFALCLPDSVIWMRYPLSVR